MTTKLVDYKMMYNVPFRNVKSKYSQICFHKLLFQISESLN